MFANLKEAVTFCEKNKIKMVDMMMIDLNGGWRHLTMPVGWLIEETFESGLGFDGSNYGFAPIEKSDMVYIPDLRTSYVDAFAEVPTLAMLGDVFSIELPDNKRFDQDPRNVAMHAQQYLASTGIADEIKISPEFEFYVFDEVSYSIEPNLSKFRIDTDQAEWNTGVREENLGYKIPVRGGYHMAPPMDRLSGFRSRVALAMQDRGIEVKYHHHEVGGPGQLEVEVGFGGLLEMADKTMITKYIIKNTAFQEGKTATFMPKPIYGEAGSGMHVHMLLFKDGKPLFYDEKGYSQLSQEALFFIGGILKHAAALCALTNPSTNSYKRLTPGYEAPVTVGYATSNRSAVIRIPAYAKHPSKKRFELRSPDGTCNPYYAYAAILMAGIDGIQNRIDPVKEGYGPYDVNLYTLSEEERTKIKFLPQSLDEALDALEEDNAFLQKGGVFPASLIALWIRNKRKETARYNQMPHPVEYEMYFGL